MKKLIPLILLLTSVFATQAQNTHSISFDAIDDYVSVNNSASLNPSSQITVSAWIKASAWGANSYSNYIVGKEDWAISGQGYALRCGANGTLSFNFSAFGTWVEVVSSPVMVAGTWYHVAGTYDGTTSKIYINGALSGTFSYTGSITNSTYNLNIGRVPYTASGGRYFDGAIDEVQVWNVALTSTQINQYMNCSPLGTETGLVGFWNFEEGTGTTTADLTSNLNTGTLTSGAGWSTDVQTMTCIPAGMEESNGSSFSIFPNPSSGKFVISVKDPVHDGSIQLFNSVGEKIMDDKFDVQSSKEIDMTGYLKGVYFLKIYSAEKQSIQRIMIQ